MDDRRRGLGTLTHADTARDLWRAGVRRGALCAGETPLLTLRPPALAAGGGGGVTLRPPRVGVTTVEGQLLASDASGAALVHVDDGGTRAAHPMAGDALDAGDDAVDVGGAGGAGGLADAALRLAGVLPPAPAAPAAGAAPAAPQPPAASPDGLSFDTPFGTFSFGR